jgi:hypothetical protein
LKIALPAAAALVIEIGIPGHARVLFEVALRILNRLEERGRTGYCGGDVDRRTFLSRPLSERPLCGEHLLELRLVDERADLRIGIARIADLRCCDEELRIDPLMSGFPIGRITRNDAPYRADQATRRRCRKRHRKRHPKRHRKRQPVSEPPPAADPQAAPPPHDAAPRSAAQDAAATA